MKRFSLFAAVAAWFGRALAVCAVMLVAMSLDVNAQIWNWARGAGGQSTSTDYYVHGYRSTVDNNGNVYVTGYFYHYATFGTTTIYAYGGSANYDMFVAKYDASGNLQWVRSGGGTSTEYGYGIDVDNNGNVYVAGYYYSNPAYFGSWSLATQTTPDVFIVKYDANGNVQWAARQAGPSTDILYNLAVNKQTGDCYIAGYFSSSTYYFSAGSSSYTTLSAFGGADGFVAKYNTNGVFQWARAIGGSSTEYAYGVGVDGNGNVYATGMTYSYPCYFGSTSYSLYYSYSTPETWLCKFDANGNYQWATWGITGSSYEWAHDLAVNASGDVAIGGYFYGTAYGGNNTSMSISSGDTYYDGFVVKFNTNGVVQWARNFGTTNCAEYARGVGIDNSGSVYLGGYTYPYSTVNWTFGSTTFSYTASQYQCWVAVWRTNGQPLGGLAATGTSTQIAYDIGVNPSRKEGAITGYYYSNPMTFGSGSGAPQLYNYIGYPAMFVGKFSVPLDYDLGLTAVASPVAPFAAGSQNISVTLRNFGAQTITSAQIFWSINGVSQTPINWTGSLSTNQSTAVNLGSANFAVGTITTISATVCCPNGQTDENAVNNTITAQLAPGLSGTYTIGGTSPDFTDVVSAANALRLGGTVGAVTFNIRPGTYSGHVFIANPPGNQQSRPIVFQSENGNAASVIIVHNGGTTQTAPLNETGVTGGEPTVRLLNADYVTFKNVTVQATGTGGSNWAVCAELMGNSNSDGCDGVTFDGGVQWACVEFVCVQRHIVAVELCVPHGFGGEELYVSERECVVVRVADDDAVHGRASVRGQHVYGFLCWGDFFERDRRIGDTSERDDEQFDGYQCGCEHSQQHWRFSVREESAELDGWAEHAGAGFVFAGAVEYESWSAVGGEQFHPGDGSAVGDTLRQYVEHEGIPQHGVFGWLDECDDGCTVASRGEHGWDEFQQQHFLCGKWAECGAGYDHDECIFVVGLQHGVYGGECDRVLGDDGGIEGTWRQ